MFNKFRKFIQSNLGGGQEESKEEKENLKNKVIEHARIENVKMIYKKENCPLRKLLIWGKDQDNNPSFLVLYGEHKFKSTSSQGNQLEENVVYTHYMIFRGQGGHFPSFEAVKIIDDSYYARKKIGKRMYYKKDVTSATYWSEREKNTISDFKALENNKKISFPYVEQWKHEEYVQEIQKKNINFQNFQMIYNPNEVLKLNQECSQYYEPICELFTNPNIYMRKKYLKEIIKSNPTKELYKLMVQIGSGELISGLFQELALEKNNILLEEANQILHSHVNWQSENYMNGLKRCADLYIHSFDEESKEKKIQFIRENLSDMDLQLLYIDNTKIPEDKILEGSDYRRYSNECKLAEYAFYYDAATRKYTQKRQLKLYKSSYYSDGVVLNIQHLKNTIQESQVFELPDVIGKIAYYLDAPRLTYYFKGNRNTKGLMYFRRYVRRIIDTYAKNDEEKFMKAMKTLLTSYTEIDYLCKFKGNFQFNYFIKHYLYYDFQEKVPADWNGKYEWIRNDQLIRQQGRYEYMHEIWNRHVDDVIDIVAEAKIPVILNALYYMLKDMVNEHNLNENLSYAQLIKLLSSSYAPISEMFIKIIKNKLEKEVDFNFELMIQLMKCPNPQVHQVAMNYFGQTAGKISSEELVEFMLFENFEEWMDLFQNNMNQLIGSEYLTFLSSVLEKSDKFIEYHIEWSQDLKAILDNSLNKLEEISQEEKTSLIGNIFNKLNDRYNMPHYMEEFVENIIFSMNYEELKIILQEIDLGNRNKPIIALLNSIKTNQLMNDGNIIAILENGKAKMVKILTEAIFLCQEQLYHRFSTVLIMLESDVVSLNDLGKFIFGNVTGEKQKQLFATMIDSASEKVYTYALEKLEELYISTGKFILEDMAVPMLEHPSTKVKQYISDKIKEVMDDLGNGNTELFLYFAKTILLLPNKLAVSKKKIYDILPEFVRKYQESQQCVEEILLEIGNSNIISDSEKALVALAEIKKEGI